jgi:hypothetical protein
MTGQSSCFTVTRLPEYSYRLDWILDHPEMWPGLIGTSPSGRTLQIWCFAGSGARRFCESRGRNYAFVAHFPRTAPESIDWSMLANQGTVFIQAIGDFSALEEERLATAMIRDGVVTVYAIRSARWFDSLPSRAGRT